MPLSDINPGCALTAINSNDAPLLEFRVKRSGTITPLGVIESIAHETSGDLLKGRLAFLTNNGTTLTPQMFINEEGNVGIGTQDPQAKLHVDGNAIFKGSLKIGADISGGAALSVDGNATLKGKVNATSLHVEGDATFRGPLTILETVTVPSLSVHGALGIGETLSVGGDVVVAGKLRAASIEGDGATLSNVSIAADSVTSAKLKEDARSLGKVSGGKMVVEDESIVIQLHAPESLFHVIGAVKCDGNLSVVGGVGIGISESLPDSILDVYSRMRVIQGFSDSAGIWFAQEPIGRPVDRAFVGMSDDNTVGFFGKDGNLWGLLMNTGDGSINLGGASLHVAGAARFDRGIKVNDSLEVRGNLTVFGNKGFKIEHPLDPANKYLYHWCVESPNSMNIYDGNTITDAEGRATVVLPDYFEALNSDFRYQLTVIGKPASAAVEREIENGAFTIKTDHPNAKVSWQVTGIRQDTAAKANRLQVEEDKPEAERGMFLGPELFATPKAG